MADVEVHRAFRHDARRGAKWADLPVGAIASSVADMELPPPQVALDAAARELSGRSGYSSTAEIEAMVQAGVDWIAARHGMTWETAHCIPVSSVAAAAAWTIARLTSPGDGVVRLRPGYPPLADAISSLDRDDRPVDLVRDGGTWTVDPDALERACDGARMLLWVSPHNPTGRVWTRAEVGAVVAVADRHRLSVFADEVWCDIVLGGDRHTPLQRVAAATPVAARTVTAVAATKTFNLAGLGCGLLHAGSQALVDRLRGGGHVPMVPTPGRVDLASSAAAWRGGEQWLADTLAHVSSVVDAVSDRLVAAYGPARVTVPEGTYMLWLDLRGLTRDDDPSAGLAVPGGVVVTDGAGYGAPGFVRLNLATTLSEALAVVDRVTRLVPPDEVVVAGR